MRKIVEAWEGLDATSAPESFTDAPWMHPEVRLDATTLGLPDEGEWVGRDQVTHGWRRWLSHWDDYRITGSDLEQLGDHILFDIHIEATGRGSGVPVTIDHVQVWTWRDGMLTRIRIFPDRASAVDAISRSARAGAGDPRKPQAR